MGWEKGVEGAYSYRKLKLGQVEHVPTPAPPPTYPSLPRQIRVHRRQMSQWKK